MRELVSGQSTLDIGVVEHSHALMQRPGWRHGVVAENAERSLGIDILANEIDELARAGFNVRVCDATSETDLGDRFERIHIGDVIEHVDNPVALLRFARRHLERYGLVLVSTPCAWWWRNIAQVRGRESMVGNADHVRWLSPSNMLELAHRSGLALQRVERWVPTSPSRPRAAAIKALTRLAPEDFLTVSYLFVLSNESSSRPFNDN